MFSPEEQRRLDEQWKQYDAEWKQPMSRDPVALELEKFRYETEARYREDQLRESWKKQHQTTPITFEEFQMYHDTGSQTLDRHLDRIGEVTNTNKPIPSSESSDSFGWFLTGCFCTLILLYLFN